MCWWFLSRFAHFSWRMRSNGVQVALICRPFWFRLIAIRGMMTPGTVWLFNTRRDCVDKFMFCLCAQRRLRVFGICQCCRVDRQIVFYRCKAWRTEPTAIIRAGADYNNTDMKERPHACILRNFPSPPVKIPRTSFRQSTSPAADVF